MTKKKILIRTLFLILAEVLLWYLFTPAFNLFEPSFYFCILIPVAIFVFSFFTFKTTIEKIITALTLVFATFMLIVGLSHLSLNDSSSKMHSDIAKVKTDGTFAETLLEIDSPFELPTIDKDAAIVIASNLLKEHVEYTEYFTIDAECNLISYNESHYFVLPLKYVNPFNFSGIPGYVLINVYTGNAKLVELENPIYYSPNAYLNQELIRHLRFSYPFEIFGNENFEIDDNGHPYYVVPITKIRSVTYGGKYIKKILVVDAVTGEIQEYTLDKIPNWIDNVYDIERIMNEAEWYLDYNSSNLSWFALTSDSNIVTRYQTNNEYYLFGKDEHVYIYTGVTLSNSSINNIAFMIGNLRTGELIYCYDYGIGENSAKTGTTHFFLENQYVPSNVLLVNIEDNPVYYLMLKNHLNNTERYAFINQNTPSAFLVSGETVDEALRNYYQMIGKSYPDIELNENSSN